MPATRSSTSKSVTASNGAAPYPSQEERRTVILVHEQVKKMIKRPANLTSLLKQLPKLFGAVDKDEEWFITYALNDDAGPIEVASDSWDTTLLEKDGIEFKLQRRAKVSGATGGEQIFVKTITGKTVIVLVKPTESVLSLKHKVADKMGIPSDQQRLICSGKQLENERILSYYKIKKDSVVHLVLRLDAGAEPGHHSFPASATPPDTQVLRQFSALSPTTTVNDLVFASKDPKQLNSDTTLEFACLHSGDFARPLTPLSVLAVATASPNQVRTTHSTSLNHALELASSSFTHDSRTQKDPTISWLAYLVAHSFKGQIAAGGVGFEVSGEKGAGMKAALSLNKVYSVA